MKKCLLSFLLALPCFLVGSPSPMDQERVVQEEHKNEKPLIEKGYHTQGINLVREVWDLIKAHNWTLLRKKMTKDFSGFNILGNVSTRTQNLSFWQELDIQDLTISVKKVQQNGDSLEIRYLISMRIQEVPSIYFPEEHASRFKKEHGTWLWKSDVNLGFFLVNSSN